MDFGYKLCYCQQVWHRSKRLAFKIHIKPRYDNALTMISKGIAHVDNSVIKKLSFIDAYYLTVPGKKEDIARKIYRSRSDGGFIMRNNLFVMISLIKNGLKYFDTLFCYNGSV